MQIKFTTTIIINPNPSLSSLSQLNQSISQSLQSFNSSNHLHKTKIIIAAICSASISQQSNQRSKSLLRRTSSALHRWHRSPLLRNAQMRITTAISSFSHHRRSVLHRRIPSP
jgi:hypothetical protein